MYLIHSASIILAFLAANMVSVRLQNEEPNSDNPIGSNVSENVVGVATIVVITIWKGRRNKKHTAGEPAMCNRN